MLLLVRLTAVAALAGLHGDNFAIAAISKLYQSTCCRIYRGIIAAYVAYVVSSRRSG